jgi:hypothetical protein
VGFNKPGHRKIARLLGKLRMNLPLGEVLIQQGMHRWRAHLAPSKARQWRP